MGNSTDALVTFDDMKLQVGDRLQLVSTHGHKKIMSFTRLIGFEPNGYLFVKWPQINGVDAPLQMAERVEVRVFSGVSIFDFPCTVEAIYQGRHHFVELSFPNKIHSIPLRSDLRTKVKLPVGINSASSGSSEPIKVVAHDLSISGAMLESDGQLGEVGGVAPIKSDTLRLTGCG